MIFWKWAAHMLAVASIVMFLLGDGIACGGLGIMCWLCRIEQKFRALGHTSTFDSRQP